jgi:hypothetical protein
MTDSRRYDARILARDLGYTYAPGVAPISGVDRESREAEETDSETRWDVCADLDEK